MKKHLIRYLIDETGNLDTLQNIEIVVVVKTTVHIDTRDIIGTMRHFPLTLLWVKEKVKKNNQFFFNIYEINTN
jgi:hypothetical protein